MEGRIRDGRKSLRWKEESEIEGRVEESELQSSSTQVPIQLWEAYTCIL